MAKKKLSLFPVVVIGLIAVIVVVGGYTLMRDVPEPVSQEPAVDAPEVTKKVILETNFGEI